MSRHSKTSITERLRAPRGRVSLAESDPNATPGFEGDKPEAEAALLGLAPALSDLQERLFANGRRGSARALLLVLQGMDTSGKGGVVRSVVALFDPQGVHIKAFKAPTADERKHDFLWRIEREVPAAGKIGVFDRSHYEDVLIARVHELAHAREIERRYDAINEFEARLAATGTAVIKCMLHISAEEQKARLRARLDNPAKHWKFNPGDVDERALWPKYQAAYELALERCNTDTAPWLIVPSDRKWYKNWAIASVLREALEKMNLDWPKADFDVDEQKRRLETT